MRASFLICAVLALDSVARAEPFELARLTFRDSLGSITCPSVSIEDEVTGNRWQQELPYSVYPAVGQTYAIPEEKLGVFAARFTDGLDGNESLTMFSIGCGGKGFPDSTWFMDDPPYPINELLSEHVLDRWSVNDGTVYDLIGYEVQGMTISVDDYGVEDGRRFVTATYRVYGAPMAVPEPSGLALAAIGAFALAVFRRHRMFNRSGSWRLRILPLSNSAGG